MTFEDEAGVFVQQSHIKKLSNMASAVQGLEVTDTNLELLLCQPKEGNPRLRDGMTTKTLEPSFLGKSGSVTLIGEPESRLIPVVNAIGVKLYGRFVIDPGDVDDSSGWEVWQLLRRTRVGLEPDTKAPRYETTTENVRLKLTKPPTGDETTDFDTLSAQVLALKGTLRQGDVVTQAGGESYAVIASPYPEGDYERAELRLREY